MTETSHPFPTVYFDGGCPGQTPRGGSTWRTAGRPNWAWLGRGPGLWLLEAGYRIFLVFRRGWRKT